MPKKTVPATTIVLPGERCVSWNTMYAGRHWSWRSKEKERVKSLVQAHLPVGASPYKQPVDIEVVVFFKNRPIDSDNICDKFYIDAVKSRLIFEDDNRYVKRVTTWSRIDKDNPRLVIVVKPHEE